EDGIRDATVTGVQTCALPIYYQLVEIPVELLKLIGAADIASVGRRKGRQSLGGDVRQGDKLLFHVHFDGSDGKCQVRNLQIEQRSEERRVGKVRRYTVGGDAI